MAWGQLDVRGVGRAPCSVLLAAAPDRQQSQIYGYRLPTHVVRRLAYGGDVRAGCSGVGVLPRRHGARRLSVRSAHGFAVALQPADTGLQEGAAVRTRDARRRVDQSPGTPRLRAGTLGARPPSALGWLPGARLSGPVLRRGVRDVHLLPVL